MPKIKQEEDEDDFEDEEDEEIEEDELEQESKPLEKRGRPKKFIKKQEPKEPEAKTRYGIIPPQPIRLADAETNEVIGEGEYLITND